jgi:hypothetical protein
MADKFDDEKGDKPLRDLTSDSGLGNLPPLSDFDSHAGAAFESDGLPPLGNFGSGGARGLTPSDDDLSAISDLDVETPGTPGDLYSSGGGVNTPSSPTPSTGFQDLAADSDFSPETPEIGPGPDSNLDTPMFDSAFGGGSQFDRNMRASLDTPAPTQAMETPMFGAASAPRSAGGGGGGFGDDVLWAADSAALMQAAAQWVAALTWAAVVVAASTLTQAPPRRTSRPTRAPRFPAMTARRARVVAADRARQ